MRDNYDLSLARRIRPQAPLPAAVVVPINIATLGERSDPAVLIFSLSDRLESLRAKRYFRQTKGSGTVFPNHRFLSFRTVKTLSNVITMGDRTTKGQSARAGVRDRRYAIRFPFAADVDIVDMESGARTSGVTSDLSLGGCFICTSKPLPVGTRVRAVMTRKSQIVEALAVVRIHKPRIGMGIEFIDVESPFDGVLCHWIDQVRQSR